MTTRAIFIDFDGVMHPAKEVADYTAHHTPRTPLKEYATQRNLLRWTPILADMLDGYDDVLLIVHSGWRTQCQTYELREFLGPLAPWFAGTTENGPRHQSIMKVVERFDIDEYIVLDDAINEFPPQLNELIACDPELGLTCPNVQDRLKKWLRETAPSETRNAKHRQT